MTIVQRLKQLEHNTCYIFLRKIILSAKSFKNLFAFAMFRDDIIVFFILKNFEHTNNVGMIKLAENTYFPIEEVVFFRLMSDLFFADYLYGPFLFSRFLNTFVC